MGVIYKREMKAFFSGIGFYLFCGITIFLSGCLLTSFNLVLLSPSIAYLADEMKLVFAIAIPLISLGALSGEYRRGTYRLLYSLGFRTVEIVVGKLLAVLSVCAIPTAVICVYPLLLKLFGDVNLCEAYLSILGLLIFEVCVVALCFFVSCLSDKAVICGIIGYSVLAVLFVIGLLTSLFPYGGFLSTLFSTVSLFGGSKYMLYGAFDPVSLIYAVVFITVFIFLTVKLQNKRRYEQGGRI